jgi:ubiquinone/menaquinone biosynthesis C-methylase UbiE
MDLSLGRVRVLVFSLQLMMMVAGLGAQTGAVTQRPTSTPYAGDLSVFEYPDRDKKLQIDRVMDLLGITAGKNVADIGAGSGWFTVRAARRVGATGAVIAEDINPLAIEAIGKRVLKEGLTNVRTVLGSPDDPQLPPSSVDAVLMLKVYHEVGHPVQMVTALKAALHPGAKVGIIDRNGNGADHGVSQKIVVKEMGEAGYKLVGTYDFTKADKEDYFLIFVVQ